MTNNTITNNSLVANLVSTAFGNSCSFITNHLSNARLTFTGTTFGTAKSISGLQANKITYTGNLTAATLIFNGSPKLLTTRLDGTVRIAYINNSDAWVITAITT